MRQEGGGQAKELPVFGAMLLEILDSRRGDGESRTVGSIDQAFLSQVPQRSRSPSNPPGCRGSSLRCAYNASRMVIRANLLEFDVRLYPNHLGEETRPKPCLVVRRSAGEVRRRK